MINELTQNDFYYCYDSNMSKFLKTKDVAYIFKAKNLKDGVIFTVYHRNRKLYEALKQYATLTNHAAHQ